MKTSFFFYLRLIFAWFAAFIFVIILWNIVSDRKLPWPLFAGALVALVFIIATAASHLRRIRMIAGNADASTLANRQRRQIEIPFEAGEAFDIVEATVRELPRTEEV